MNHKTPEYKKVTTQTRRYYYYCYPNYKSFTITHRQTLKNKKKKTKKKKTIKKRWCQGKMNRNQKHTTPPKKLQKEGGGIPIIFFKKKKKKKKKKNLSFFDFYISRFFFKWITGVVWRLHLIDPSCNLSDDVQTSRLCKKVGTNRWSIKKKEDNLFLLLFYF